MGRSTTFKYRIEEGSDKRGWKTFGGWRCADKGKGKPTDANLARWRNAMNASFLPGGVNHNKNYADRYSRTIPQVDGLRLVEQSTGRVVAVAPMPMFETIGV